MLVRHVAVVSEVANTSFSELAKVAAAVQKQVIRDFAPLWEMQATVDAFAKLEDVPIGYWPVIVQADIGYNAAGIHLEYSSGWSLTVSHEVLEMLGAAPAPRTPRDFVEERMRDLPASDDDPKDEG
jgi:hypothetical protein